MDSDWKKTYEGEMSLNTIYIYILFEREREKERKKYFTFRGRLREVKKPRRRPEFMGFEWTLYSLSSVRLCFESCCP